MFTVKDIDARLRGQPFIPLRIVTTTGQTYDIAHPELVVVARRYLFIGVPGAEDPVHAEDVTRVSLMHITEIRDLPTGKPISGNGEA